MEIQRTSKQGVFTVNLARYYTENLCPRCEERLSRQNQRFPPNSAYKKLYLVNAKKQFGNNSLPLCFHCFADYAEECRCCLLPVKIAFIASLGNLVLSETTLVQEHPDEDHKCVSCVKNNVSDLSDSESDDDS
jgi:hypothetical protein